MEIMNIVDDYINKIKKDYKDDISIVGLYGSYLYGDTHEMSDVDLFFIPKTNRGYEMCKTFIYKGIGMDFWPISWERAEEMAQFRDKTAIIKEAKVLFYSNEDDLRRFKGLQDNTTFNVTNNELKDRASEHLLQCYKAIFKMKEIDDNFDDIKIMASYILEELLQTVILYNGNYMVRGTGKTIDEIKDLKDVPEDFINLHDEIIEAENKEDTIELCENIIKNTEYLIETRNKVNEEGKLDKGFYEELKSTFNKIYDACDKGNRRVAFFATAAVIYECKEYFKEGNIDIGYLPQLYNYFNSNNLAEYKCKVKEYENEIVNLLEDNNVEIEGINNEEEFIKYLEK